ncbi:MAG: excinuclease ABC subunit A, partial [Candidatus Competibacteraceae bacterium]|nr:excinuclease ABC subunit A [Candidatus Competibacteraceae bacterium]
LSGKSIADVLELTVSEALQFFAQQRDVQRVLEPLAAVGLDYLRLGQPVPTLSGGEAQRLKLAGHLAATRKSKTAASSPGGTLFIFDEPTTGLHFEDIAKLLQALQRLLDAGNSIVVIEHNLDVIQAADWLIDLGPEGGEGGGTLVCEGTPATVMTNPDSHTGAALRDYQTALQRLREPVQVAELRPHAYTVPARSADTAADTIRIHNAREHNLKNIDLDIPRQGFTVITGVSGSGKSTVAFDILFAEGQRRYLESLNAYARQFVQPAARPDMDALYGIPPTVAIEQRTSRGGRKSTVATLTEIYHFLRLLFVKLGVQFCPDCAVPIEPQSADEIAARILRDYKGKTIQLLAPLIVARKGYYTDLAKWAAGKGYDALRVDGELLPTADWPRLDRFKEHDIELPVATLTVTPEHEQALRAGLSRALDYGKGSIIVLAGGKSRIFSTRRACSGCGRSFNELDPRLFSYNSKHGWCGSCYGTGLQLDGFDAEQSGEEAWWNAWYEGEARVCRSCQGQRLCPQALAVKFRDHSIAALTAFSVQEAERYFRGLKLHGREAGIGRDILTELRARLAFLREVGLSYLSLDRAAPTLSGGEAQRIRLAAQLGSNLRGVCYILDEPTIGLHPRDNKMLLDTLSRLEHKGNTVLVVEHDEDTIRRADHIIDLGPGAGSQGGEVVATGGIEAIMASPRSLTGQFLRQPLQHPLVEPREQQSLGGTLVIRGARLNNLHDIDVSIPLQRLVCVTGVSGSGKSTLVRQIVGSSLKKLLAGQRQKKSSTGQVQGCRTLEGWQNVQRLLEV